MRAYTMDPGSAAHRFALRSIRGTHPSSPRNGFTVVPAQQRRRCRCATASPLSLEERAVARVSKDGRESMRRVHASRRLWNQHPRQMLEIPSPSSLSRSLTVARAAGRCNLAVANRVRLIFTARCTGSGR